MENTDDRTDLPPVGTPEPDPDFARGERTTPEDARPDFARDQRTLPDDGTEPDFARSALRMSLERTAALKSANSFSIDDTTPGSRARAGVSIGSNAR